MAWWRNQSAVKTMAKSVIWRNEENDAVKKNVNERRLWLSSSGENMKLSMWRRRGMNKWRRNGIMAINQQSGRQSKYQRKQKTGMKWQ